MNTPISIHDRTEYRSGYAFILIFALMAIGIVLTGYFYYRDYEQKFRANVENQLSGIAELKVGELALWRKERLGDGAVLFKNKTFSALVRRFLERPGDTDAQRQLQAWMGKYLSAYHYTQAHLVDANGGMRMSAPQVPGSHVSSAAKNVAAAEALRSGQVGIDDFHRNTPDGPAHLAVVIPIFDDLDDRRPLGVLFLHIDPKIYLYSFISRWPTPSQTAETLLVRRDGDDVLFLNELRFREDAPLNLRIPLARTEVPAVRAALGQTGVFEGVDYRGVPVVAAIRAVPDSPWSLIARMNTSEVYAPVRERLGLMAVFIGTLLLGAGITMSLVWRQMGMRYRERDKAAEVIRAAEERYRSIFAQAADAIWLVDAQTGAILDFNTAAHESLGYTREEFARLTIADLEAAESPDEIALHMEKVKAEGHDVFETVHRTMRGEPRNILVSVKTVTFGEKTYLQSIQRDITERKRSEDALLKSEANLRAMLDNSPYLAWLKDAEGRYITANKAFADYLRLEDPRQIEGRTDMDLQPQELAEKYLADDVEVMASRQQKHIEEPAFDGNRIHWVETFKTPIVDTHGKILGTVGFARDITERKEYEEELKRSNAELEQFSYAVSHDMRQPLRMISSYLQLLEMSLGGQLDSEQRSYIAFAVEGAKRIDRMLVELLEYSRVGRMGESPDWIESRAVLDKALQFLQPVITEAQAKLDISGDWPRILASHDEILRLLQNLIGNAAKFRIAGRTPEITVTSKVAGNEWHLSVADNGVGIIPGQAKRLFQVFQRLQSRDAYEGNGVGLALCRKIAEHHKGRIWAESEGEGKGSKFCVVLPVLRGGHNP